jgi:hypothetical protein
MAVAKGTSHHADTVGTLFKSLQDIFNVYFARAGQFDNFGPGWVGDAQGSSRVGSHVGTIDTGKDSDLRIETIIRHVGRNLHEVVVELLSGTVALQAVRLSRWVRVSDRAQAGGGQETLPNQKKIKLPATGPIPPDL